MAKLLYITASPQDAAHSFSRKVSDAFVSAYQESHPDDVVDTLDVWTEQLPEIGAVAASWKVKAMTGQTPNAAELAERASIESVTSRFQAADKYVISSPVWNFQIPYRLKHFIDVVVQPGLTFGFDPAKGYFGLVPSTRPVHLIIASAGTYGADSPMAAMNFHTPYVTAVLGFMGLSDVRTQLVECTAYGAAVSDPIVAKAIQDAMVAARTF